MRMESFSSENAHLSYARTHSLHRSSPGVFHRSKRRRVFTFASDRDANARRSLSRPPANVENGVDTTTPVAASTKPGGLYGLSFLEAMAFKGKRMQCEIESWDASHSYMEWVQGRQESLRRRHEACRGKRGGTQGTWRCLHGSEGLEFVLARWFWIVWVKLKLENNILIAIFLILWRCRPCTRKSEWTIGHADVYSPDAKRNGNGRNGRRAVFSTWLEARSSCVDRLLCNDRTLFERRDRRGFLLFLRAWGTFEWEVGNAWVAGIDHCWNVC